MFTGSAGLLRGIITKSTQHGLRETYAKVKQIIGDNFTLEPPSSTADADLLDLVASLEAGNTTALASRPDNSYDITFAGTVAATGITTHCRGDSNFDKDVSHTASCATSHCWLRAM